MQALYFKPSYERLRERIHAAAPQLDVVLYDEAGRLWHHGVEVLPKDIKPDWCWIHTELFFSPLLHEYFRLMLHMPSLKWLHTVNTGLDKLPYLELVEKGVTVTNNHAQAIAIAEFVFGQLLAYWQNVYDYRAKQQQKLWKHRGFREVHGTHWLVVGFGEIGKEVARRAKAFGATVTAVRRKQDTEGLADFVAPQDRLLEELPKADVVVIACAANASTRDLVNKHFLDAMKEKSVLINIARGDLVVEAHLHAALDHGKPDYAILDVFNHEPPAADSWVWTHPRVSLTPHTSNGGTGMRARSEANFLDNLALMVKGQALRNVVRHSDII
jgi:phosphoglycerate dehydrogenase-like enzyme